MPANKSVMHTFNGQYFDVIVWRGPEPDSYAALIRARQGSSATVFKSVIECSKEQLGELQILSKLARMLIDHLEAGMSFAVWTDRPNTN